MKVSQCGPSWLASDGGSGFSSHGTALLYPLHGFFVVLAMNRVDRTYAEMNLSNREVSFWYGISLGVRRRQQRQGLLAQRDRPRMLASRMLRFQAIQQCDAELPLKAAAARSGRLLVRSNSGQRPRLRPPRPKGRCDRRPPHTRRVPNAVA